MNHFYIRRVATGVKFDLRGANGQTVATSQVYKTEAACRKGIASVRSTAPLAGIEDLTEPEGTVPNPKFQIYLDKSGRYRFRLKARNGAVIAASEPYTTRPACLTGIQSVRQNAAPISPL